MMGPDCGRAHADQRQVHQAPLRRLSDRTLEHRGEHPGIPPPPKPAANSGPVPEPFGQLPSLNHQVVIDADTRLVVAVGKPLPGNRNDCLAWEQSGAKDAVGLTPTVIADGGYHSTGPVIPHYRRHKDKIPADWKQDHNARHRHARARVEHVFARMKSWKILRDCRLKGDGVHHAVLGIARLHNLALTG